MLQNYLCKRIATYNYTSIKYLFLFISFLITQNYCSTTVQQYTKHNSPTITTRVSTPLSVEIIQPSFFKIVAPQSQIVTTLKHLSKRLLPPQKRTKRLKWHNIGIKSNWRKIMFFLKKIRRYPPKYKPTPHTFSKPALFDFFIKFKKRQRVYVFRRKKDDIQLRKQHHLMSRLGNHQRLPTSSAPTLRLRYNYYLVTTFKKIKHKNIAVKNKKARSYFKKHKSFMNLYKSRNWVRNPVKNTTIYQLLYENHVKPCNSPFIFVYRSELGALIKNQDKVSTKFKWTKPQTTPALSTTKRNWQNKKEAAIRLLFSFYNTNLLTNNFVNSKHLNINTLLKFQLISDHRLRDFLLEYQHKKTAPLVEHINSVLVSKQNQRINITNFYPLFYFLSASIYTKKAYNSIINQSYYHRIGYFASNRYKIFYVFFLVSFLQSFLQKKIWIRADSRDFFSAAWKQYLGIKLQVNIDLYRRFNRLISVRELTEILIIMFATRDLQIFLFFLKNCFEKSHFKKHKKILSIVFDILRKNKFLLKQTAVKGFYFDIRGKVGVSGNAKKRHLSFSIDKITTTSQNVRSYWQQINVWTPTGQMGITCYMLF